MEFFHCIGCVNISAKSSLSFTI